MSNKPARTLIPDPQVARQYSVHYTTLANWDKDPDLGFPKPVRIKKRKYRDEAELKEFDRARAAERETDPGP